MYNLFSFVSGNYKKNVKLPSQIFCKAILMFLQSEEKLGVLVHPLPDAFSKKKLSFVLHPKIPQKKKTLIKKFRDNFEET